MSKSNKLPKRAPSLNPQSSILNPDKQSAIRDSQSYDVIIIGGGLVGNSFACMLADQGWRIAVIENKNFHSTSTIADNRSIVLTYTSYQVLNALGLWPALAGHAYPIKKIHVSQPGKFGAARFEPQRVGMPLFGYVISGGLLTKVLKQAMLNLAAAKKIDLFCPAEIENITGSTVTFDYQNKQQKLVTELIVGADGTQSKVRELAQINTKVYDYQQTAIIAVLGVTKDHQQIAYERLTPTGPLAMLPRDKYSCGVVWTVKTATANEIMNYSDETFLENLQQAFGYRLGKLHALKERSCYPLKMVQAKHQIKSGLVLLGNAAHTLHPIAGQGFNLGLRDAAALAEVLLEAKNDQQSLGKFSVLDSYERWRAADQGNIIRFTDRTVRLFTQEFLPLKNTGLVMLEHIPFLKYFLTKRLLGFSGKTARLICGIPYDSYEVAE